jgi:hypothetical protein
MEIFGFPTMDRSLVDKDHFHREIRIDEFENLINLF